MFRVLRPLKTIVRIKELKKIVGTLFAIQSLIFDAILVILLFNVLFAVIGL